LEKGRPVRAYQLLAETINGSTNQPLVSASRIVTLFLVIAVGVWCYLQLKLIIVVYFICISCLVILLFIFSFTLVNVLSQKLSPKQQLILQFELRKFALRHKDEERTVGACVTLCILCGVDPVLIRVDFDAFVRISDYVSKVSSILM
jgi:hypothetical protein